MRLRRSIDNSAGWAYPIECTFSISERTVGEMSMVTTKAVTVKKVSATTLRSSLKGYMKQARGGKVVLIESRRQESKYLVDKDWLDTVMRERESILATLEILADRELTNRLLKLAETVDEDVRAGRLHTMEEVFGEP